MSLPSTLEIEPNEVKSLAARISSEGDSLSTEISNFKQYQQSLASHWYGGKTAPAAQESLTELVNLYDELLKTVTSTHDSLTSAATNFDGTDESGAALFTRP